mmetsp:Transcript_27708/g.50853  ORF Transcript_27708/g.50853 Transcript_27708/m.50853 type:complete len:489 (-) Transcript_27708:74-1540(-)
MASEGADVHRKDDEADEDKSPNACCASPLILSVPIASSSADVLEETDSSVAGSLAGCSFQEALHRIELDLLAAVQSASAHPFCEACEPSSNLLANYHEVVCDVCTKGCRMPKGMQKDCWEQIMCWRIAHSWRTRDPRLIWLDDKVEQVCLTASLLKGRELHLPLYAHALAGDAVAEDALRAAALDRVQQREPVVIKPRHGANSRHVFLWSDPATVTEEEVSASVQAALTGTDASWERECWQLSQVPKGAVLQPMYAMAVPKGPSPKRGAIAPIELKVQVLFSKVVGATLNTHPQLLWVMRSGSIQLWQEDDLRTAQKMERNRKLDQRYGRELPAGMLERLQEILGSHWGFICESSEKLACAAGLDEIRVDWLVGDECWGPRIGELTYMGAGARLLRVLSVRLARAYAAGHLCRKGQLILKGAQVRSESDIDTPQCQERPLQAELSSLQQSEQRPPPLWPSDRQLVGLRTSTQPANRPRHVRQEKARTS